MSSAKEIWVYAEQENGKVAGVVYELLTRGRMLAEKSGFTLCAVLASANGKPMHQELFNYGAKKIYNVEDPKLDTYQNDYFSKVVHTLIEQQKPEIVLYGATTIGRSLAPTVAVMGWAGLTADCTELDFDTERGILLQTRPAFGGNIMATILCPNHRPQMATVRHKVLPEAEPDSSRTGEVITESLETSDTFDLSRVLEVIEDVEDTVNITEANIIVSGGRGMKGPENFELLHDLAKKLNGAVGASRSAVDEGWIPYSHQVGQTGKTVNPKVYIACGISGQIQHLVGMQSSDIIVAINKDADAPLMKMATFALCGDLFQIIPALIKKLN